MRRRDSWHIKDYGETLQRSKEGLRPVLRKCTSPMRNRACEENGAYRIAQRPIVGFQRASRIAEWQAKRTRRDITPAAIGKLGRF